MRRTAGVAIFQGNPLPIRVLGCAERPILAKLGKKKNGRKGINPIAKPAGQGDWGGERSDVFQD